MASPTKRTVRNRINRELGKSIDTYHEEIPLDEIFDIVKSHGHTVVDKAGDEWSGILCGEIGQMNARIIGQYEYYLHLSWYKMQSGRWEITVYVS